MIKTAIVGCGHWGRLLIRSFAQSQNYHLRYFCDIDPHRLEPLKAQYGYVNLTTDLKAILKDAAVDAVVIATPLHSHFEITKASLLAGKHVLVEQPLATHRIQCDELTNLANRNHLTLMVDHIDEYNTALKNLNSLIRNGDLGDLRYLYAQRLNLGESTSGSGVLMELATHEIYMAVNMMGLVPFRVSANGLNLISPQVEDVVFATIDFENGVTLNIHASWLDPNKVRRLTVVGSTKMAVYDDISSDARITIYNRQATLTDHNDPVPTSPDDSFEQFRLSVRTGDVIIPKLEYVEPLQLLSDDFSKCVQHGKEPDSDGARAARVVALLEASRQSMKMAGTPVELKEWN